MCVWSRYLAVSVVNPENCVFVRATGKQFISQTKLKYKSAESFLWWLYLGVKGQVTVTGRDPQSIWKTCF